MTSGGSASPRRMADLASADSPKTQNAGAHSYPRFPGQVQLVRYREKKTKKGGIRTFFCTNPSLLASESETCTFPCVLESTTFLHHGGKSGYSRCREYRGGKFSQQSDLRFFVRSCAGPNEDSPPSSTQSTRPVRRPRRLWFGSRISESYLYVRLFIFCVIWIGQTLVSIPDVRRPGGDF